MTPRKLTTRLLDRLSPGDRVRDTDDRGLFAECGKTGAVALKFQADLRQGPKTGAARKPVTVRVTLGTYPETPLDVARQRAAALRGEIRAGRDPRKGTAAAPGMWTVARLITEYTSDLRTRGKADRTIADYADRFDRYLKPGWGALPLPAVTRTMARDAHARITSEHGPVVANDTLRNFRAAYNWARKATDLELGENPAEAVSFNPQRPRTEVLTFPDLRDWHGKVSALGNPLRVAMHELGLFSGLRPGTLVALERAWIRLDDRAIVIPAGRMKARKAFALPLSPHMASIVKRALAAGDLLFPSSAYLFPTRAQKTGEVIATQVWKEKALPSETGHVLRHMYSNACNATGVTSVNRMLLMGQKVPGIEGVYLQERALFASLLTEQARVTAHLLKAIGLPAKAPARKAARRARR